VTVCCCLAAEVVVEWVDDGKVAKAMNAQAVSRKGKAGRQLEANSNSQHVLGMGNLVGGCQQH